MNSKRNGCLAGFLIVFLLAGSASARQTRLIPSADQQAEFIKANYTKTEHAVPMRDGVKLFTQVYAPKDHSEAYPILIKRTPYGIRPYGEALVSRLGPFWMASTILKPGDSSRNS